MGDQLFWVGKRIKNLRVRQTSWSKIFQKHILKINWTVYSVNLELLFHVKLKWQEIIRVENSDMCNSKKWKMPKLQSKNSMVSKLVIKKFRSLFLQREMNVRMFKIRIVIYMLAICQRIWRRKILKHYSFLTELSNNSSMMVIRGVAMSNIQHMKKHKVQSIISIRKRMSEVMSLAYRSIFHNQWVFMVKINK